MQNAVAVIEGLSWFQGLARKLTDTANLVDVVKNGRGDPEAGEGTGLTTSQINDAMAPYRPHYLGTIARDGWGGLTPPPHKSWSGWIMNTDK